ncbi:hypothetical protein E1B28_008376 [Marasmius oreades]|uniref:Uncharacterized protein n=1 Tax=Marasmius oreades TaxID=181124 RepID=A0A9P7RY67_9AGAR|nr:uncharacterized protein E1B28_008376 [Marasmius oreades]KAG7091989.1 hypothetical protein E1B28_008376 [Marasmius oreades]
MDQIRSYTAIASLFIEPNKTKYIIVRHEIRTRLMENKRKVQDEGQDERKGDADDSTSTSIEQPSPKRARSTSLPDVNAFFGGNHLAFLPKQCSDDNKAFILNLLVNRLSTDSQWEKVLKPEFKRWEHCEDAIKDAADLGNLISDCFEKSDWRPLFEDSRLRYQLSPSTSFNTSYPAEDIQYFKEAFEKNYRSSHPDILLSAMDLYHLDETYYNRSFSVVQSSGMGKSRLVDHSATLRFTIPFNIQQDIQSGGRVYPPSDRKVRDFITATFENEVDAVTWPLVFLQALFTETVVQLKNYKKGQPQAIARLWYDWMKKESTVYEVGKERTKFYDRVEHEARKLAGLKPTNVQNPLRERRTALRAAATSLVERLQDLYGRVTDKFCAIVYFDEAHTLFPSNGGLHKCTPYFALMTVLNMIRDKRIFFVFLSTNPSLQTFAPNHALYPSIRVQNSYRLIPPFFELPFDTFSRGFTTQAKAEGKLTLAGVCDLGQMAKFGRPM